MKNNRLRLIKNDGGNLKVVKSRNSLIRLYNALRQKGGWRAVQKERGAKNVAIVYNFAVHGMEPKSIEDRKACFLYKEPKSYNPLSRLPKWFEKTEQALQWFNGKRQIVKDMNTNTREALRKR